MDEYDGKQFVGIDLHWRRSVVVRQSESGEHLSAVRILNDPVALGLELQTLAAAGVTAIVHPGGSVRDEEVTAATAKAGVSVYLTGARHFAH